jgi:AcrR family transcriptional regulator
MGTKERREREKNALREQILAGVRHIAQTKGWAALTMREIAKQIEYSPAAVYEYFDSKEDIILELFRRGFEELAADFQAASEASDNAEDRIIRIVEAYWRFAHRNYDLYQVMHGIGGVELNTEGEWQSMQPVIVTAQSAIEAWAASEHVQLDDPLGATEAIWSLMHGFVSNSMVNRIQGGEARAYQLVQQSVHNFLTAWKTT